MSAASGARAAAVPSASSAAASSPPAFSTAASVSGAWPKATRPANRPATYAVSGIVQASGSPVEGATVCFQGKEQGARSATGLTDAQGRYRLTTFTRGDGAPPGDYRVIVFKYKETPTVVAEGEYSPPTGPEPPPQHELPPKYATANTSGLEATVGTSSLEFNIDLQP